MTNQDDLAVVEAVLNGDADAFEAIVERWKSPLVNLAYRYCLDRGRAEDLAQEAFLRAFRNLHSWRREAAFSTWLFAVAANLYRTELKRLPAPQPQIVGVIAPAALPASRHIEPEALLRDREMALAVRSAVTALPARYRDPIIHYYFHERNLAVSAAVLGLPEGTLKARLSRGRALLRARLAKWEQGYR